MAGGRIQVSGRLIRKQDCRFCRKRPCNRDSLLLSAGQSSRKCFLLSRKSQKLQNPIYIFLIHFSSIQLDRKNNIFINIQIRHKIIILKNEPDLSSAKDCKLFLFQSFKTLSVNQNFSFGRHVQPAKHMQKRTLSRTAFPDNCNKFPILYPEIHAIQCLYRILTHLVIFFQISCLYNKIFHWFASFF